jgi:protoporphyrinogen/coproporphyrinogen III oxidase
MSQKTAIVVGGGLGGMTTAYRLKQAGYQVTVFEKCPQPEGRNKSVRVGDCIIDVSATLMGPTYDQVFALVDELGLNDQLEECHGNTATIRDGKMHLMSIDSPNMALVKTGLLSLRSKFALLKLQWELMKHAKEHNFYNLGSVRGLDQETLYEYCQRNFPDEVYEYLLNPMHKFLYLHDGKYGAVVELFWWMQTMGTTAAKSFKYGTSTLVKKLAENIDVRSNHAVQNVRHDGRRACVSVEHDGRAEQFDADVCVITTQGPITAQIYPSGMSAEQHEFIATRRYERVTVVSFCTTKRPELDVVTIQMPSSQNPDLGVIIFAHKIASTRAPADKGIINTYFLHDWAMRHADKSDEEVMQAARKEIGDLVPEVANLDGYYVQRWEHVAPIHEMGACARIDKFIKSLDPTSPVQLIGDYMVCPSMNVAVTLGNRVSARIIEQHNFKQAA